MQEAVASFRVNRPIDAVFDFLSDINKIGWCIDGVKEVKVEDSTHSQWKVEVRAGFISQSVKLAVVLTKVERPTRLEFTGSSTQVDLTGTLTLSSDAEGTQVSFKAIINAKGPIGPLIDLVMGHTAEKLTNNTVEKIRSSLEAPSATGAPAAAPAR